ncbi:MAG: C39 family peptidase [Patescibacteria group bacterium]
MLKRVSIIALCIIAVVLLYERNAIRDLFTAPKHDLPSPISYADIARPDPSAVSDEDTAGAVSNDQQTSDTEEGDGAAPAAEETLEEKPLVVSERNALNLAVPFQPQAPHANWDLPYQEACEEASVIMVDHYLRGDDSLTADEMDDLILELVVWETEHGYPIDVSVEELVRIVQEKYGWRALVLETLTESAIREQLNLGRPVIVPAAGRELHNPYFRQPGPLYHMLVIKGYTTDGHFITNDPGTRRGADYVYDPAVLLAAAHDWTGEVADGPALGLVMYK